MGSLMVAALAVGVTANRAAADEVYKGTFGLQSAVYWGNVLLQPGQYTITLEQGVNSPPVFYLYGEGVRTTFMTSAVRPDSASSDSLKIENINGAYVVRELDAGILGKSFAFAVPKGVRNNALDAGMAVGISQAPPRKSLL
jgi:hypothetical protein